MWLWVCSGDGGELGCISEIMESKRKEKKSLVKHVASLRHFNHILIDRTHVPHRIKDLACAQFSLVLCT